HSECEGAGLLGNPAIWNRELLNLRKQGKLPKQTAKQPTPVAASDLDQYQFAAEIAWRLTAEKFGEGSLVAIFSSPEWSQLFDRLAARYAPGHPAGDYRRAALLLRKQQTNLAAEAKEYHYVFRTREFESPRKLTQRNV